MDAQSGDEIYYVNGDYGFGTTRLFAALDPTTDIQEIHSGNIEIAPNPPADHVNIKADVNLLSVIIIDYLGRLVYTSVANGNQFMLNTSGFKPGIYFIQIETENGIRSQRVIIE